MLTAELTQTLKDSCTLLTEQHHRIEEKSRYVTLRCHGSKISGSQQTVILQIWQKKNENVDMYDLTVHDCTQEQNNDHLCQE